MAEVARIGHEKKYDVVNDEMPRMGFEGLAGYLMELPHMKRDSSIIFFMAFHLLRASRLSKYQ